MYLPSGLSFFQKRRTSCTMDGFCHLYLLMILLMRSGDVETNPGPHRIVSEEEFMRLSKLIEPSYYKEVGVNLGIPNAKLGQIMMQHMQNTSDALMTVFTSWRDKQPPGTDIRALLAEGLKRSDLGSLAGSLVPNRTGAPVTMPGSQTQPLSPDLIKRCADDFKFKYRTTLCKIRADPLNPDSIVPFNDMYTNLVLEEGYRDHKRPLEYRDFFDLKVNGEFPKRIVIQGEAGAGKTTFCAKIAWDWINNSPVLPKFKWVLVVPFREAKQYTIGEIAKSYLSKNNPATACQITEYIRSNPKDVFIAFDGLDEFGGKVVQQRKAGSKSECHQPKSADQTKARGSSSERSDIAITDILRSDELEACPVLVTSRPWKVTDIRWDDSLRKLYTFIHVEGFSKENVEAYIHKYFEDDVVTADQLIQLTKENDIISETMAPYPIYIAMLCLMWRKIGSEKQEKFRSFRTFSQIFYEMFEFLKVHYAQKAITDLGSPSFQAYLSQIEKFMKPVAKVAFNGLQENTLIFREDDFEQCSDSLETACKVGVLSQEKRLSSVYDKSSPYLQSTIFFPHKLFQEYMAGVHLASLYELDHNEFNRLIEQVVLPRKEEFRYLLYFTVSQDKAIANHVMKCMVQGNTGKKEDMDFLVDVSFESQDLDTAALVRGKVSSPCITSQMTVHTIEGFVFAGIHLDVISVERNYGEEFGPTIAHDLVEIICSAPSLKNVSLRNASFPSDFYAVLAKEGNKSMVRTLTLEVDRIRCPTSASSHHLADALCSMPNLTELSLHGNGFQEEFYSTLNAKASTLQVQTVKLLNVECPTSASSHHLVEAVCSMPNLAVLILRGKGFQEEFYSTLKAKASTLQVRTVMLLSVWCPTSASSHHLVEALCSMPNLNELRIDGWNFQEEFFSTLNAKASTLQVKVLMLEDVRCSTLASSRHLAEASCSVPNLTLLALIGKNFKEEFYSTLNAKASTLQVHTLMLQDVQCPTLASSHHLVKAVCSMPNLTVLELWGQDFQEELYFTLIAKSLTLQLKAWILWVPIDLPSDYKDDEESFKRVNDAIKRQREEGCAPKTPLTSDKEDEEELVLPIKGNEIPAKKKRTHDSNDSDSTPIVKTKKKEDEDYGKKKEQTKQEDDRRIADGSERKERGESTRRYDEARSSYHSTRYEDDETIVKRREDEQGDRNDRWDREREAKLRIDKRERERGRRGLDGERETEGRRDGEEQRNDRSVEREDNRDRRNREKERDKRDREGERQRDSRDRGGEREDNIDRRDRYRDKQRERRDREVERQRDSRDRDWERERDMRGRVREKERDKRDREGERQQDIRDRHGERDRRDRDIEKERGKRDREGERRQDSRDRGGERGRDTRDRVREKERDKRDGERERQRDSRDRDGDRRDRVGEKERGKRDREGERQQDSRDRGGERGRDTRDRDREKERDKRDGERERQVDSRDRHGERDWDRYR